MTTDMTMKSREPVEVCAIALDDLYPCNDNPRSPKAEDKDIQELAANLDALGLLESLGVRAMTIANSANYDIDGMRLPGSYEVRYGHRRLAAARYLGWEEIRCAVFDWNDEEAFLVTMNENKARKDLTPLEEVKLCQSCLDRGFDIETTAAQVGLKYRTAAGQAVVRQWLERWSERLREGRSAGKHGERQK